MNKTAHTKSANVFLAVGDLLRTMRSLRGVGGGLGKVEHALTNPVAMGRRSAVENIGKAVAAPVLAPALGVMGVASKVDHAAKAHDPLRLLQMRSREAAVKGMSNRPVDRRQFVTDMMRGLLNPDVRQAVGTLGTAAVRGAATLAEKIASMEKQSASTIREALQSLRRAWQGAVKAGPNLDGMFDAGAGHILTLPARGTDKFTPHISNPAGMRKYGESLDDLRKVWRGGAKSDEWLPLSDARDKALYETVISPPDIVSRLPEAKLFRVTAGLPNRADAQEVTSGGRIFKGIPRPGVIATAGESKGIPGAIGQLLDDRRGFRKELVDGQWFTGLPSVAEGYAASNGSKFLSPRAEMPTLSWDRVDVNARELADRIRAWHSDVTEQFKRPYQRLRSQLGKSAAITPFEKLAGEPAVPFRTTPSPGGIPAPVNTVTATRPSPTSSGVSGGFRADVGLRQPAGPPPLKPMPSSFATPTLSSVTPAHYKQPYYGANFQSEIGKAQAYNTSNELPGNQNQWTEPLPVVQNDERAAANGPYFDNVTRTVHMPEPGIESSNWAEISNSPEILKEFNLTKSQVPDMSDTALKHESYHGALNDPAVRAYDGQALRTERADNYRPVWNSTAQRLGTGLHWPRRIGNPIGFQSGVLDRNVLSVDGDSHQEKKSPEMRDYMSQLQEHQFKNTGKRFESPQEYDEFLKGVNPTQPDEQKFESGIQQYPVDAQRMFRQMRKTNQRAPEVYDNIRNWQRTVIPGIVQNNQDTPFEKLAGWASRVGKLLASGALKPQAFDAAAMPRDLRVFGASPEMEKEAIFGSVGRGISRGLSNVAVKMGLKPSFREMLKIRRGLNVTQDLSPLEKGPGAVRSMNGAKGMAMEARPPLHPAAAGTYYPELGQIRLSENADRGTLRHELMHAYQHQGRGPMRRFFEWGSALGKPTFKNAIGLNMIEAQAQMVGNRSVLGGLKAWGERAPFYKGMNNATGAAALPYNISAAVAHPGDAIMAAGRSIAAAPRKIGLKLGIISDEPSMADAFRAWNRPTPRRPSIPMTEIPADGSQAAITPFEKLARYRRIDHAHPNPSQAQIASQNFKMGHVDFHGIDITIENEKDSVRRGTTKEGKKWESVLTCPYGYIRSAAGGKSGERVRPKAIDGDHLDVFVGPNKSSELVVVIDQHLGGKYDESKFLLGCDSQDEGVRLYRSNYQRGWPEMPSTTCTLAQFKEWLKDGDHKKPFAGQMVKAASRFG